VTCTGGGTCECDNGFEGPDCSEGDLGVPRTIISLNPNDPDRELNVPAYLVDRFDNPAIDDEIASRRVSRLQASTSQGSNSDVIVAQRYYFYTIARTRISAGGLLPADTPLVPPTETPFVVSFSAPSAVLNVATTTASLPRAPLWQLGTMVTGGRIDVRFKRPLDSGGVEPTGYRLVITNSDDSSQPPVVLQGETEKCTSEMVDGVTEQTCTGVKGLTEDPLTKAVTYSRGALDVDNGYEYVVQMMNDVGAGDVSESFSVRTNRFPTPPGAIQSPKTEHRTGGSITLSFLPPMDTGGVAITSYEIEIGTNNKDDENCIGSDDSVVTLPMNCFVPSNPVRTLRLEVSGGDTTLTITGLVASTTYWARARADNGDATSGRRPGVWRANEKVGLFPISTDIMTNPSKPDVPVVVSVTGGMITIKWLPPFDFGGADRLVPWGVPDLTGYRIFMRKKDSNAIDFVQLLETKDQNILEYQIGYLEKETEYEFRVRAMNEVAQCDDTEGGSPLPNDDPIYVSDSLFVTTTAQTPPGSLVCNDANDALIKRCTQVFGTDATSGLVTGGMVTVEMTVPKDTGGASLSNLRYKVEMISKNGPKGTAQALGTNSLASSRILGASACDMSSLNTRRITLNGDGDWNTNDMFVPCIATQTCSTTHSNKNSCSNDEACEWKGSSTDGICTNQWELSVSTTLRPEEKRHIWRIQLYHLDHTTKYEFRVVAYDITVPTLGNGSPSDNFEVETTMATPPKQPSELSVVDLWTCTDKNWALRSGSDVCSDSLVDPVSNAKTCTAYKRYEQAEKLCSAHNARICTLSEIAADQTTDPTCGNDKRVWSSTSCNAGTTCSTTGCVYTQAGSSAGSQSFPTACTPKITDVDIHVRCCTNKGTGVRTLTGGRATFQWKEPLDLGGNPISEYFIQQASCTTEDTVAAQVVC
jgi:hypothetical protein